MRNKEYVALYMWTHATQDMHKGRKLSVAIRGELENEYYT